MDAAIDKVDNFAKDMEIQRMEKKWDELYELTNKNQESGVELAHVSENKYEYGADAFEAFQENYAYKSDTAIANDDMKKQDSD